MPTHVERVVTVPARPDAIWEFVADPATRAETISVVSEFEQHDDHQSVWYVNNPLIPGKTLAVEIEEQIRDPPNLVSYDGTSSAFELTGRHELEASDQGCTLSSQFDIEQHLPGVEEYFEEKLDEELQQIEQAIVDAVGHPQR